MERGREALNKVSTQGESRVTGPCPCPEKVLSKRVGEERRKEGRERKKERKTEKGAILGNREPRSVSSLGTTEGFTGTRRVFYSLTLAFLSPNCRVRLTSGEAANGKGRGNLRAGEV